LILIGADVRIGSQAEILKLSRLVRCTLRKRTLCCGPVRFGSGSTAGPEESRYLFNRALQQHRP